MRGRLIKPLLVEICRIDTAQTEAAGAMDTVFRTVKMTQVRYHEPIRVQAQIEAQATEAQTQTPSGNVPETRYQFVLHMRELEQRQLVGTDGRPIFRINDKVTGIYSAQGAVLQLFEAGIFVTEVQAAGLGLGGRKNLVVLVCQSRPQGIAQ